MSIFDVHCCRFVQRVGFLCDYRPFNLCKMSGVLPVDEFNVYNDNWYACWWRQIFAMRNEGYRFLRKSNVAMHMDTRSSLDHGPVRSCSSIAPCRFLMCHLHCNS